MSGGFLFLFLNAFFRGCTCLKCTNQARAAPTKQELHQPSKSCTNQARAAPTKQELHQPSKSYTNQAGGSFRGCTCLKCTNKVRTTPTKQEEHQPSKSYFNIARLVHLRQVHPLKAPPESTP